MINHGRMICIKYDPWFTRPIHHAGWAWYLPLDISLRYPYISALISGSLDQWASECSSAHLPTAHILHLSSHISWNWLWELRGGVGVDMMALPGPTPSWDNCATPPTGIITRLHNESNARRAFSQLATYYYLQASIFIHLQCPCFQVLILIVSAPAETLCWIGQIIWSSIPLWLYSRSRLSHSEFLWTLLSADPGSIEECQAQASPGRDVTHRDRNWWKIVLARKNIINWSPLGSWLLTFISIQTRSS